MKYIDETISKIKRIDITPEKDILNHLDNLTKPPKSLGQLEVIAYRYCLATRMKKPILTKKKIFTFAGDHGVASEGVSAYPKDVTPQMVQNMLQGGAAVNVLARHVGAELSVIDIGVDDPLNEAPGLIRRKVKSGTSNIAKGPAMTKDEAISAVTVGIELANEAADNGFHLIGTGEMGIGNTTAASSIMAALLPCEVKEITGRGTGIDDQKLSHKIDVIERSLTINKEQLNHPMGVLAAVGGLEIAGLTGLILGAASRQVPIVVDGFISSASALVAMKLCSHVKDYLFFSHKSAEAGHNVFLKRQGIRPVLDLDMRLGEGTGAALAMSLIEASIKVYNEMATFQSADVSQETQLA